MPSGSRNETALLSRATAAFTPRFFSLLAAAEGSKPMTPTRKDSPPDAGPSTNSDFPTRNRSEEHTSELQSRFDLVCRLLLEKKKRTLNRTCTRHTGDIFVGYSTKICVAVARLRALSVV